MMISDFHSHVLPAIDDGSATIEESLAMLRLESQQGVSRVVATPHFYARQDQLDSFLRRRENAAALLRQEMASKEEFPALILGAEVHYFKGMSQTEALRDLVLEGTKAVLIEMPYGEWTEEMYRELEQIPENLDLQPIIAHIDRYIRPFHKNENLTRMLELPVVLQANTSFFLERKTSRMSMRMLEQGQIRLIGSDCHNLSKRPPNLQAAVDKIFKKQGEICLRRIVENENQILAGNMIVDNIT